MIRYRHKFSWLAAVLFLSTAVPCRADLLLNGFADLTWDLGAFINDSPTVTISVTANNDVIAPNSMNAFSIGIRFVPVAGATGSISATSAITSNSTINNAFAHVDFIVTNNLPDVLTISGTNNPPTGNILVVNSKNLLDISFKSNNAIGKFDVYAVPEFTNYFTTTEYDGFKFANVPITLGASTGPDVYLGSVTAVTAVPEPSSFMITSIIALLVCIERCKVGRKIKLCIPLI